MKNINGDMNVSNDWKQLSPSSYNLLCLALISFWLHHF